MVASGQAANRMYATGVREVLYRVVYVNKFVPDIRSVSNILQSIARRHDCEMVQTNADRNAACVR